MKKNLRTLTHIDDDLLCSRSMMALPFRLGIGHSIVCRVVFSRDFPVFLTTKTKSLTRADRVSR